MRGGADLSQMADRIMAAQNITGNCPLNLSVNMMLCETSAACAVAYLRLEDIARLARVSPQMHDVFADLGAGIPGEIRQASRRRFIGAAFRVRWWANVLQVDETRKVMLKRERGIGEGNVGFFERSAGLYDGTRSRRGGL